MIDARELTTILQRRWSGGHGTARCPAHDDKNPSLSLSNGANGRLLLKCHSGCSFGDIQNALGNLGYSTRHSNFETFDPDGEARRMAKEKMQSERRSRQALELWHQARPINNTLAEKYLRSRGISSAQLPTLRYEENCWHPSAKRLPAIIARIEGSNGFAVHRTYLRTDGTGKTDISPSKAMLGNVQGGAVRLSRASGTLVVAEGIETALSLLTGFLERPASVWASLSAGGMQALRLPKFPEKLVVAADGDTTGQNAARLLAERAHNLGWQVTLLPAPKGYDWNDVLTGKVNTA